jgi:hypothetical protein
VGTSLEYAVPVNKLQPKSARVYVSRTINIYRSNMLCNWTLISGSGAFNRSTLEANMPGVPSGGTVRMEWPKLARATDVGVYGLVRGIRRDCARADSAAACCLWQ